jgi:serine/threonine protein kinase
MSKREVQDAVNEIRVLASVRHPHIVSFLQAFLDKGDSELCIIMEYCGCGDLAQKVDRYKKRRQYVDERVIWAYLIQMSDALKCLHAKNIVHRDLKTANCFLSEDGTIKIGDLNVSKRMKNGLCATQIGTPYYMSPEIWANRPYNAASDMWALGCTLYELAALRPPFLGDSFPQLKRAVQAGRYPSMPRHYSSDLDKVIGQMIRVNPRERPTSTSLLELPEVVQRRNSDWFNKLPTHEVVTEPAMMKTIQVPKNIGKLAQNLPQACYPEMRPNTPEAWPATERDRPAAIERKQSNTSAPPPSSNQSSAAEGGSASAANGNDENVPSHRRSPRADPSKNDSEASSNKLMPIQPKGSVPQARKPFGSRHPNAPSSRYDQQSARPGYVSSGFEFVSSSGHSFGCEEQASPLTTTVALSSHTVSLVSPSNSVETREMRANTGAHTPSTMPTADGYPTHMCPLPPAAAGIEAVVD